MTLGVLITVTGVVIGTGGIGAVAHADHDGTHVPWSSLLPPLPSQQEPSPSAADRCGEDGLVCVRRVERILGDLADHFGCDHRAVFATTYQLLTREIRRQLESDPGYFDDPGGLGLEAETFLGYYLRTVDDYAAGKPIPPAWQTAFDANLHSHNNAGQDMLGSINAHVQRDMPFVLERIGLTLPSDGSRKPDHDRQNAILARAYDEIVPLVGDRYDPIVTLADADPSPVDDLTSGQLVTAWREGVWRNAERLVGAGSDAERQLVEQSIEANANAWGETVTSESVPGYRSYRDAYCLARADGRSVEEAMAAAEAAYDPNADPSDGPRHPPERGEGSNSAPHRSAPGPRGDEPSATDAGPATTPALPASGGGAVSLALFALATVWLLRR